MREVARWTVSPSEAFMPQEIVENSGLNGQDGSQQVVEMQKRPETRESRQLNADADPANDIEFQPVD